MMRGGHVVNNSAVWVEGYVTMTRLRKMGFSFDSKSLSSEAAQIFVVISQEIDRIEREDIERKSR